ncbi:MAG TPA: glycosyl transferase family 1 [Ignavibacteriales bacterium]|nr:glycosyl transferase family 1 [Ignavibacteriales bacterium]
MFKVLVVAYYFPPLGLSGVQRTLKFVKYMKNYNWEPTVITTGNVAYFAHDKSLTKELSDSNIRIIRVSGSNEPNSILSRLGTVKFPSEFLRNILDKLSQTFFIPDNKISWSKLAAKKIDEILSSEKFDAIFVTCPPFSAFDAISKIKKNHDVPLFADYRDLWFKSYFAFYPTPFHKIIHKNKEYHALRAADRIIVTNRKIKEKLLHTYPFLTFDDVVIISHGYDQKDFDKIPAQPKPQNKMVLMYSGIFMVYNSPVYLLKAFKQLTVERPDIASNIELHFVGFLRKENQKLIRKLKLQQFVKDHGYVNHDESIAKLKSADVLWFMVGRRRNIDAILPGKVYEYIGARKPILACVPEGAAKMAVEESGAGYICGPDNVVEIKNMILKIFNDYKNNKLPTPSDEVLEKFRRDNLTELLTKQFQLKLRADV